MTEISTLIKILEDATRPDREIDIIIWRLIGDGKDAPPTHEPLPWLSRYTESIDAALTLVPSGWGINCIEWWERGTHGSETMRKVRLVNYHSGQFMSASVKETLAMGRKENVAMFHLAYPGVKCMLWEALNERLIRS